MVWYAQLVVECSAIGKAMDTYPKENPGGCMCTEMWIFVGFSRLSLSGMTTRKPLSSMPQKPKSQPKNITTNIFIIVGKTHHNYFVGGSELIKNARFHHCETPSQDVFRSLLYHCPQCFGRGVGGRGGVLTFSAFTFLHTCGMLR